MDTRVHARSNLNMGYKLISYMSLKISIIQGGEVKTV